MECPPDEFHCQSANPDWPEVFIIVHMCTPDLVLAWAQRFPTFNPFAANAARVHPPTLGNNLVKTCTNEVSHSEMFIKTLYYFVKEILYFKGATAKGLAAKIVSRSWSFTRAHVHRYIEDKSKRCAGYLHIIYIFKLFIGIQLAIYRNKTNTCSI